MFVREKPVCNIPTTRGRFGRKIGEPSRARLKPETMTVTFEEFGPTHDFLTIGVYERAHWRDLLAFDEVMRRAASPSGSVVKLPRRWHDDWGRSDLPIAGQEGGIK
jgi:hypothetical protein